MKKTLPFYIVIALFITLGIAALVVKKLGVPFGSLIATVSFIVITIFFLSTLFARVPIHPDDDATEIKFDFHHFVFSFCAIAIIFRFQNWIGWLIWTIASFVLISFLLLMMIRTNFRIFKQMTKVELVEDFLEVYYAILFFLTIISISFFTNTRQFYNIFNAGTYEQYVRANYPAEEGTMLLEQYKPGNKSSVRKSALYFSQAKEMELKEKYDEALEFYNKAIDLDPDNAEAIEQRGYLKLTHLELSREMARDAIADFTRAIELNPDLTLAYYHRAMANEFLKPTETALMVKDLQKVITLDTSYRSNKFVRGYIAEPR